MNNSTALYAWKATYTAKDTWLGPTQNLGALAALYNLTMDPFEKYDMFFNGAMSVRTSMNSPGKFTADNGAWQDAWPDAGVSQYRGEKGTTYEAGWRVPGIIRRVGNTCWIEY